MGTSQSVPSVPSGGMEELPPAAEVPYALVVCGPSGVGKGTLISWLMSTEPDSFGFSVSHTTRDPRPNEQDGVDYHFVTKESMSAAIEEGLFLEHASVHGNLYGTSVGAVQGVLGAGRCCVLDIDVQGARLVRASGLQAVFVFVAPPSEEELLSRLRGRGTESEDVIAKRLGNARREMEAVEEPGLFDFLIVNDSLESAKEQLFRVASLALAGQDPATLELPEDDDDREEEDEEEEGSSPGAGGGGGPGEEEEQQQYHQQRGEEDSRAEGEVQRGQEEEEEEEDGEEDALIQQQQQQQPRSVEARAAAAGGGGGGEAEEDGEEEGEEEGEEDTVSWAGKVAVVTGASSGIGRETAMELLQAGVKVVAVARRRDRLEQLQADVLESHHGINPVDFLPIVCDVTKEAEVLALPRIISKRWPGSGIDILVNNAAVGRADGALVGGSTAAWVEMVSTNILGLSMCTREAVQDMERRGAPGHIVNIGQLPGRVEGAREAFYGATKAAVAALTDGLREEVEARGLPVRITLVSPSSVRTEFSRPGPSSGGSGSKGSSSSKAPRASLQPRDVAAAVLWSLTAPRHVDVGEVVLRAAPGWA